MYAAVPRITPACVAARLMVGEWVRPAAEAGPALERLGEPEVEHLDPALGRDLDVGGLQVAVDDAVLVRLLERLRDLERDAGGLLHRDGAALDAVGERVAGDQLHHQRGGALALLEAVDRRDVRMVERGEHLASRAKRAM